MKEAKCIIMLLHQGITEGKNHFFNYLKILITSKNEKDLSTS